MVEKEVDLERGEVNVKWGWKEGNVRVKIKEDGEGLRKEIIERIGEKYMKRREKKRNGGGIGIGMLIEKKILES